ncbi:hypothetical protein [Branchiibius cervicis]|uniref:Restriction endonuclease n=1 Tax=Branchiibius cervicis TaxID=908252 RepID=A0ABW2AYX3_9MICO
MDRVNWRRMEENDFNRLVEDLLVREFTGDGRVAHAIDGRGGDGGIDVEVRVKRTNQLLRVFQLKHFPEGFSGGHADSRRRQIKKSLNRVLDSNELPGVWTLVTPINATVTERKVVTAMRPPGVKLRIDFMGTTELDHLLIKHPDIESWFLRDPAKELLKAVHRESAVLTRPGDLLAENQRIGQQLASRSQYWGTAYAVDPDGTYTETLFARRPDAAEREPLGIRFETRFGPEDADIMAQVEQSLGYGAIDPVTLPERVVQSIEMIGPEWFAAKGTGSIEWWPVPDQDGRPPTRAEVLVGVANRDPIARLSGTVQSMAAGPRGRTIRVVFDGGITQTWRLDTDGSRSGSMEMQFAPAASTARDVRRAVRFLAALAAHGQMGLSIDGSSPGWVLVGPGQFTAPEEELTSYLNDLRALEEHFDVNLHLPVEGISTMDRLWARILVKLLNGEVVSYPGRDAVHGKLNGSLDSSLERLLTEGAALFLHGIELQLNICGTPLTVGQVAMWTPHAVADDAERLRTLLSEGHGAGERFTARPAEGTPWAIYRLGEKISPNSSVVQPWEVPGVPEHPGFERLLTQDSAAS